MAGFGKFCSDLILDIIHTIGIYLCLTYGWEWFVMPLGIKYVGGVNLYGLYFLIKLCTESQNVINSKYMVDEFDRKFRYVCEPYVSLFMMFIVNSCM